MNSKHVDVEYLNRSFADVKLVAVNAHKEKEGVEKSYLVELREQTV